MQREPHNSAAAGDGSELSDRFGRTIRKLRVSLTDRCNYRCIYCMPECPVWSARDGILTYEEILRLVGVFVSPLGIEQVRLTGGEPLMRQNVAGLVGKLGALRRAGLRRISLSTNGALLVRHADELAEAGLDGVNVSLDSLSPQRFHDITGGGRLSDVMSGIESARRAGLLVKINCVVMRGANDCDVLPIARWAYDAGISVRFIEFMPLDSRGLWRPHLVFPESEILALLRREYTVSAQPRTQDPARYYLVNGRLEVGIISTVSNPFCARCDRIRLTADGRLLSCLFSESGVDLKTPMRSGATDAELEARIRAAVFAKPRGFIFKAAHPATRVGMHVLGG
jgi:cyclic pyranopterin phosphate synthase